MRTLMVANEMVALRVNAALRASKMVLARGDNYLVLWMADTKVNETPDLSELRRIERDPATNEFYSYKAPADLAEADDTQYALATTDFDAATEAVKGSAVFPSELWGSDVTAWATAVAGADLQQLCYVGYRVTTTLDDVSVTKVGGAALRNH